MFNQLTPIIIPKRVFDLFYFSGHPPNDPFAGIEPHELSEYKKSKHIKQKFKKF
jgi:hypothetical protein